MTEKELVRYMDTQLSEIEERCKFIREEMALLKDGISPAWGFITSRLLTIREKAVDSWDVIDDFTGARRFYNKGLDKT